MHSLPNGLLLRNIDLNSDTEPLREIVAQVWHGSGFALMEQRFGPIGGKPWVEWLWPQIFADLQSQPERSFVAVDRERVVGFCTYNIDAERRRGIVGFNAVAPSHQGQGLGAAMIRFVMDRIRGEDVDHAIVVVQDNEEHAAARHIYEKHGFSKVSGNLLMAVKL